MIRFCHKEVYFVTEDAMDKKKLEAYFLNGHESDFVCIVDKFDKFVGIVTYPLIFQNKSLDFIKREYVLLDEDIWTNSRKYFAACQYNTENNQLLPVLDTKHVLICFAWQDNEANREIRMLDELMDCDNALDFREVYPNQSFVRIQECNELAYSFACYLRNIGTQVYVEGLYWEEFNLWKDSLWRDEKEKDSDTFIIYSEGIGCDEQIFLRSVSSEFECINKIYEVNLLKGIISDTDKNFQSLLDTELQENRIGILGTGIDALNTYDLLLQYGIDIYCFVSDKQQGHRKLLGKDILTEGEMLKCNVEILIEPSSKNSAWGFGGVDKWHYLGYRRNKNVFLLQDYMEIPNNGLFNILKSIIKNPMKRLVLVGEPRLCLKLSQLLESLNKEKYGNLVYCDITSEYTEEKINIKFITKEDLNSDDSCVLLLPDYFGKSYRVSLVQTYALELWKHNVTDYVDYPLNNIAFLTCEGILNKNRKSSVKVGKILLGSINAFSGNSFFRGVLDDHPDILTMHGNYIGCNLFSICIRLSMENSTNLLSLFWKIYDEESEGYFNTGVTGFPDRDKFNHCMKSMLEEKDTFTSYELFVMLHVAYAEMWGKEIKDISRMVIYWEPHDVPKNLIESYVPWLQYACVSGYIVNIVRNSYIRAGSYLRWASQAMWPTKEEKFLRIIEYPNKQRKNFAAWKRICMRFEDLKCDPKKELQNFCDETGIDWSDTMLDVKTRTSYGSSTGFDLLPVYRLYEEYFSTFDRFRISLITSAWQKKHGYPFVSSRYFSRRELIELFSKKFRFEENCTFSTEKEKIQYLKKRQQIIEDHLWMNRKMEVDM